MKDAIEVLNGLKSGFINSDSGDCGVPQAIDYAIKVIKERDEAGSELPEKNKYRHKQPCECSACGFQNERNQAIDDCTPVVAKLKAEIAKLKASNERKRNVFKKKVKWFDAKVFELGQEIVRLKAENEKLKRSEST